MHDRVGDGLAQRLHRVFWDVLAAQAFDAIGRAGIALNEAQGVLNVGHNTAVKVPSVEDVDLVRTLAQQAGDVCLREEMAHVLGEEEYARVAEEQVVACPLGSFDVDQHVFNRRLSTDAGQLEPSLVLLAVEVLRVVETGTGREIEPDHALTAEEIADFVAAELLGHCTLTPEEALTALHWLGVTFPYMHC